MVRIGTAALLVAFSGALASCPAGAQAQTAPPGMRMAQATPSAAETSRHVRPRTRIRVYPTYETGPDGVYPRYNPGPNAVRECSATYVREYRPSGTVIVPRMSCFWRPG